MVLFGNNIIVLDEDNVTLKEIHFISENNTN